MDTSWKSLARIGVSIFILYVAISHLGDLSGLVTTLLAAALPILLGAAIAYPINLAMSFFERRLFKNPNSPLYKRKRSLSMLLALVSFAAVCGLVIGLVAPQLMACAQMLLSRLPGAIRDLVVWLNAHELLTQEAARDLSSINWTEQITKYANTLLSGVGSVVTTITGLASRIVSGVTTGVLSLFFALYILADKETLGRQFRKVLARYTPAHWRKRFYHVNDTLNLCLRKYLVAQCGEALILGSLCTLGMWLLKLPYALMIGVLVAFTALVPVVGAFVGGGIGAFLILTESFHQAVIFLVFLVLLQQFEEKLIYPRVVGASIGLPGIWVLAAVTVGGGLFGVMGMFLGVPVAAACYKLLREQVNTPKKKKV